jgi:hypothetical protein
MKQSQSTIGALKIAAAICAILLVGGLALAVFTPQNKNTVSASMERQAPISLDTIHINRWPEDVPCNAIRKNDDGSYTQVKDIAVGGMHLSGNSFANTGETRYWDQKCGPDKPPLK